LPPSARESRRFDRFSFAPVKRRRRYVERLLSGLLQLEPSATGFEIHFFPACNEARGGFRGQTPMWLIFTRRVRVAAGKAPRVSRLCLVGLGLLCSVAATKAESPKPVRAHPVKAMTVKVVASNKGGLAGVNFSDPYAPPVGTLKTAIARFPVVPKEATVDPQDGFSLTAGRDSPDAPFTGGVKFRF
jgi:hypothetical protein